MANEHVGGTHLGIQLRRHRERAAGREWLQARREREQRPEAGRAHGRRPGRRPERNPHQRRRTSGDPLLQRNRNAGATTKAARPCSTPPAGSGARSEPAPRSSRGHSLRDVFESEDEERGEVPRGSLRLRNTRMPIRAITTARRESTGSITPNERVTAIPAHWSLVREASGTTTEVFAGGRPVRARPGREGVPGGAATRRPDRRTRERP